MVIDSKHHWLELLARDLTLGITVGILVLSVDKLWINRIDNINLRLIILFADLGWLLYLRRFYTEYYEHHRKLQIKEIKLINPNAKIVDL